MDPVTLSLLIGGGSSLLGGLLGGDGQQERRSYQGAGVADPKRALSDALMAIRSFGSNLESRGPARLSAGSTVAPPPRPGNIPGLGFQIGGGLGTDPALLDQTILQGRQMGQTTPMQSLFQGSPQMGARKPSPNAQSTGQRAKQRQPRSE
jgi:hypothetical protein